MNKEIETYKSIVVNGSFYQKNYFDTNIFVDFPVDEIVIKSSSINILSIDFLAISNEGILLFSSDIFDNNIFHHYSTITNATVVDSDWEINNVYSSGTSNNINTNFKFNTPKTISGQYRFYISSIDYITGLIQNIELVENIKVPFAFTFEFRKYKNNKV